MGCAVVCASFVVGAKPRVSLLSGVDVGFISVLFTESSFEPQCSKPRLCQLLRHRTSGPFVTLWALPVIELNKPNRPTDASRCAIISVMRNPRQQTS